jgi:tagatose-1,6-bisphosphate aldolase
MEGQRKGMERVANARGVIAALAIDQRGARRDIGLSQSKENELWPFLTSV